jgi:uncharacterized delta-60 repeat protein
MDIKFTLQAQYDGSQYIAGPFNLSGTTDTNVTYELATNISKSVLLTGYTVTTPYNITGGTIQSLGSCITTPTEFYTLQFLEGPIVVGNFDTYSGIPSSGIVKLTNLGYIDYSFDIGTGFNTGAKSSGIGPSIVTMQSDGKVLVGGNISTYQSESCKTIIRLNPDGSRDRTFNLTSGFVSYPSGLRCISCQPDGKILVGGVFSISSYVNLIRLNIDGSIDTSFSGMTSGGFTGGSVETVLPLISGNIYVGGYFTNFNGSLQSKIVLLNSGGTKNNLFVADCGAGGFVNDIKIDNYGDILIGGVFASYNGTIVDSLVRVNPYGSLDLTFTPTINSSLVGSPEIKSINIQSDNKIVIAGYFLGLSGVTTNNIGRLLYSGYKDTSFTGSLSGFTGGGFEYPPISQLLTDGSFFVTGGFTTSNGQSKSQIVKLTSTGDNDNSFVVATESYTISDVYQSYYVT